MGHSLQQGVLYKREYSLTRESTLLHSTPWLQVVQSGGNTNLPTYYLSKMQQSIFLVRCNKLKEVPAELHVRVLPSYAVCTTPSAGSTEADLPKRHHIRQPDTAHAHT